MLRLGFYLVSGGLRVDPDLSSVNLFYFFRNAGCDLVALPGCRCGSTDGRTKTLGAVAHPFLPIAKGCVAACFLGQPGNALVEGGFIQAETVFKGRLGQEGFVGQRVQDLFFVRGRVALWVGLGKLLERETDSPLTLRAGGRGVGVGVEGTAVAASGVWLAAGEDGAPVEEGAAGRAV